MTTTGKKVIVRGVQVGLGQGNQTPVRLELDTFLENPDRKNLYLLALARLQSRPQSDKKSWYQICGIHGRPYVPWDGEMDPRGRKPGGYCTHSSILFLPWHRPYMALYEQVLFDEIQGIVSEFPTGPKKDRLSAVARTFRVPYWDWAAKSNPNSILLQHTVTVEKPSGRVEIPNPLYSYTFADTSAFQGSFKSWKQTIRYPRNGQSQDTALKNIRTNIEEGSIPNPFAGGQGPWINIRERIWLLLNLEQNNYPTFTAFSNNAWYENGISSDYDSLEAVHDWFHGTIGGGGHMSNPDYAGFDPLFWLHHCQVDRLYALWQAIHPDADLNWEFGDRAETFRSFNWWVPGSGPNRRTEENTPLVPFHETETTYWDSNNCRDFKKFGYTYPELTAWNTPSTNRDALSLLVAQKVKALYGNTTTGSLTASAVSSTAEKKASIPVPVHLQAAQQPLKAAATAPTVLDTVKTAGSAAVDATIATAPTLPFPIETVAKDHAHREYFVNLRAPKYAFNGPYAVHVFLGDFSSDPEERAFDKNLVGSWHVFANDVDNTGCINCLKSAEENLIVTGAVPLTSALLERIEAVGSLDTEDVERYLKKELHWRIHKADTSNIGRSAADGLVVAVTSALVKHPTVPGELPSYEGWNPLPEVTEGRRTGAGYSLSEGYQS